MGKDPWLNTKTSKADRLSKNSLNPIYAHTYILLQVIRIINLINAGALFCSRHQNPQFALKWIKKRQINKGLNLYKKKNENIYLTISKNTFLLTISKSLN